MKLPFWLEVVLVLIGAALITYLSDPELFKSRADDAPKNPLAKYALAVEKELGLPSGILPAICSYENRSDVKWRNVASHKNAIGVCQILESTALMVCPECTAGRKPKIFMVGSRSEEVKRIQAVLVREGLYDGAVDGVFGRKTERAVSKFQANAGLGKADGIVGPQTWSKMFSDPFPGTAVTQLLWDERENIRIAGKVLLWIKENVSDDPAIMMATYYAGQGHEVVVYMLGAKKHMSRWRSAELPEQLL